MVIQSTSVSELFSWKERIIFMKINIYCHDEKDLESLRYHAKATDEEIEYDIDEEIDEVVSYTVLEDDENA